MSKRISRVCCFYAHWSDLVISADVSLFIVSFQSICVLNRVPTDVIREQKRAVDRSIRSLGQFIQVYPGHGAPQKAIEFSSMCVCVDLRVCCVSMASHRPDRERNSMQREEERLIAEIKRVAKEGRSMVRSSSIVERSGLAPAAAVIQLIMIQTPRSTF